MKVSFNLGTTEANILQEAAYDLADEMEESFFENLKKLNLTTDDIYDVATWKNDGKIFIDGVKKID